MWQHILQNTAFKVIHYQRYTFIMLIDRIIIITEVSIGRNNVA
jgi:hypothetical protein